MPILDLTDEEAQQLTLVLANASGPGISWMMTNGLLTKLQAAAQPKSDGIIDPRNPTGTRHRKATQQQDGLDLTEN